MKKISLVFPNQLFKISDANYENKNIALIEDSLFFGFDSQRPQKFHRQKIIFHKSTMFAYKDKLMKTGFKLIYIPHERGNRTEENLAYLMKKGFNFFDTFELFDELLEKRVKDFCLKNNCNLKIKRSEMFITNKDLVEKTIRQKKILGMRKFYVDQRRSQNILIEKDGSPTCGQWSFDKNNRKKLPTTIPIPNEPSIKTNKFVEKAKKCVSVNYKDYFGNEENFCYPVTHEEAEKWLEDFLIERLDLFGDYEDAISSKNRILWHSVLSPLINTGLLTPKQILNKSQRYFFSNKISINSYEGFIRQIIGWREFMLIIYKRNNLELRNGNFWGFEDKPIPSCFYTGKTGIKPLDNSIKNILETGYAHHIERLMIIGNFMLLCRVHPNQVYKWFMELFIDSYDWVMVPNVYGMSQFSNGGLFTTKVYISGSNYIRKMSNFKSGDWCKIWDALFWNFIDDYKNIFEKQYRMSMLIKNYEKMNSKIRNSHKILANEYLAQLT